MSLLVAVASLVTLVCSCGNGTKKTVGSVTGRVRLCFERPSGSGPPATYACPAARDASIVARDLTGLEVATTHTDPNAVFRFSLAAGTYTLSTRAAATDCSKTVRIAASEQLRADIRCSLPQLAGP